MIKTTEELNLTVKGYRLMTLDELAKFENQMPETDCCIKWWLSDIDPEDDFNVACAEGIDECDDIYVERDRLNVFIRPVLDIEGTELKSGDEFMYKGFIFTILDENTAISNNFLGCAKYYDTELSNWWYYDEDPAPPANAVIYILESILGQNFPLLPIASQEAIKESK